ncbi:MAG: flavin reductase family protein [Rhodopirellula sp.]|nr:flavin reductase family protein [Rhodopirellula sp.]
MKKRSMPLSKVYGLLEPGPVVLLTTAWKGQPNVMPMSWLTMLEFSPPQFACVVSNRNHSFDALRKTRQCVVNIPTAELAEQVVGCGNTSGRKVDKFKRFGLTPLPAATVEAPLIDECYANLECRVIDTRMVNKYSLFVLEATKAWIASGAKRPRTIHHEGRGMFIVAERRIKLPSVKL